MEFKSPHDELCIDQFSDLMTYIFRFQSKTGGANEIKLDEITGTLFRSVRPKALFREFERLGGTVERPFEGIYYLKDFCPIPVQVIVGDELNPDRHAALRVVADALKNIMETLHLSLDQAMEALRIPPEEKATFAALV